MFKLATMWRLTPYKCRLDYDARDKYGFVDLECREYSADNYVSLIATHSDHLILQEPYVYKEHLPSLRFIGKCYTNSARMGGFGHKWGEWFENGWFGILEKIGESQDIENGYLGFLVPGTVYYIT